MKALQILTTITGVVMSLGYFPQAYKLYKSKSPINISIPTFTIFALGTLIWTIYGFALGDLPLILSFMLGVIGSWLVLGLAIYYRRNSVNKSEQ